MSNATSSNRSREAGASTSAPKGPRFLYPGVDFIRLVEGDDDAPPAVDFFAVDEQNFELGNLTGARAAFQLLAFGCQADGDTEVFRPVIERAVHEACDPATQHLAYSRRGAAIGFLDEIEEVLRLACKAIDIDDFIHARAQRLLTFMEQDLDEQRAMNAALFQAVKHRAPTAGKPG